MEWIFDDGGRAEAGFKGRTGDCVCRAICNAVGLDYKTVYNDLFKMIKAKPLKKKMGTRGTTPRNGVPIKICHKYIEEVLGWVWHPTMKIGKGCRMHLNANELPSGIIIVRVSNHLTCVKDGVIHDTYDCSREESRCVYGYWSKD